MRAAASLLAGAAAFVALFPFSGSDTQPPDFYSVFGYSVPVGGIWLAMIAGAVAVVIVWILIGLRHRR